MHCISRVTRGDITGSSWHTGHMTSTGTRTDGGQLIFRARLGGQLRALREASGVGAAQAARHIRVSASTLSRMENAKQASRVGDIRSLADLYGAPDRADELAALAERSAAPAWWSEHGAEPWVRDMLAREAIADRICAFETALVHGLLQTEDYMRAVRSVAIPDAIEEETKRAVDFRLARQQHLADNGAPRLHVVLEQAVVDRPIGDRAARCAQLEHLVAEAGRPETTIQIIPTSAGAHPAMGVSFTAITVGGEPGLDAVYLEDDRSGRQLTRLADLQRYREIFDRLTSMAWSPDQTVAYLSTLTCNA